MGKRALKKRVQVLEQLLKELLIQCIAVENLADKELITERQLVIEGRENKEEFYRLDSLAIKSARKNCGLPEEQDAELKLNFMKKC